MVVGGAGLRTLMYTNTFFMIFFMRTAQKTIRQQYCFSCIFVHHKRTFDDWKKYRGKKCVMNEFIVVVAHHYRQAVEFLQLLTTTLLDYC